MAGTVKFLRRSANFNRQVSKYGQLLNNRSNGQTDNFYMSTGQLKTYYTELVRIIRGESTLTKNIVRQVFYDETRLEALKSGLSEKQAILKAQSVVAKKFDITVRTVQRSVDTKAVF